MPAANPKFTSMDITFITGPDNKEPETLLEVFLIHENGLPDAAYLAVHGQGYPSGSVITPLPVIPRTPPPPVSALYLNDLGIGNPDAKVHEFILVKITHDAGTNGSDNWDFNFNAVLHFDDGTKVLYSTTKTTSLTLDHVANEALFDLKTATIARPAVAS
jgi:hypothetical protein